MVAARAVGVVWCVLMVAGCSDGNRISDAGPEGASFATGGTSGASGAGGAGGTAGTNTLTGGSGGSAGMNLPDGGLMMLECDTTVPTTATCGGTQCPTVDGFAAMICTVPCCVNDQCGTRNTSMQLGSECGLAPVADERCPSEMFGGMTVEGCCTDDNRCGIADTFITNSCMAREDLPFGNLDPLGCDEAGDAGL